MFNRIVNRRLATESRGVSPLKNEDGIVLIAALVLMLALSALGITIVYTSSANIQISSNTLSSSQAFMGAEAGIAEAIDKIRNNSDWGPDLDNDGSVDDDAGEWGVQSTGSLDLGKTFVDYTITLYDSDGSYGRKDNSSRLDRYVTLDDDDILIEVMASVKGMERVVSMVLTTSLEAFEYAIFSEGSIDGIGAGDSPGTFNGAFYAKDEIALQGNYNVGQAGMESTEKITPSCASGKFKSCDDDHDPVDAPLLDFAYYQDQNNFDSQQVVIMRPTVGASTSCGSGCKGWVLSYEMEISNETYYYYAYAESEDDKTTVRWCAETDWDGETDCSKDVGSYTYESDDKKPFINAEQFNAYTTPSNDSDYESSIVSIIDTEKHLEFMGPPAGSIAFITATILIGTSSNNDSPDGKIDFYGNGGTIEFVPANGLAVVAEDINFKAKYGDLVVTVGNAGEGAIIIASDKVKFEGGKDSKKDDHDDDDDDKKDKKNKHDDDDDDDDKKDNKKKEHDNDDGDGQYDLTLNFYGSLVVGGDDSTGEDDSDDDANVELSGKGNGTTTNFTYVETKNLPGGWLEEGSQRCEKSNWREVN